MGRPNRIQFPGACYYITLQGNNRQDIFLSNQDRRQFLALLKSYKEHYGLKVYAYCLMNNTADLLIETASANLSQAMQGLNTSYTKHFNRAHNTTGHLFQGRYRALLVDKKDYLFEMTVAIHLKPASAGLKEKPWRYLWCSCAAYVESAGREPLVDTEPVLKSFARNRLTQSVRYLQLIKERMKAGAKTDYPIRGGVIGSAEFAAGISGETAGERAKPGAREVRVQEILSQVLSTRKIDQEALFGRSQWRDVAAARKEAVYRLWKEARIGVTEIGRMFKRTPSAVSQLIRSSESLKA
ncbi:MAG: transposase [Proteobacteria bacterium]|nr:transposase [Pseudomonadota bacterium]